ncbi:MAG: ABC transporter permease [Planctomycetes bacterium]|nr:ABC transporter permease [Planctomycetota bacterium]
MLAYVLRRLLLMVPTFIGILIINFVVLRMQGPTLKDEISQGSSQGGEGQKIERGIASLESFIARFERSGANLPSLVNTRGFADKADAVRWLRAGERRAGMTRKEEAKRARSELDLWFLGRWYAEPLQAVLADNALAGLHGPASVAFSYAAYIPVQAEDYPPSLSAEQKAEQTPDELAEREERMRRLGGIVVRNAELRDLRVSYHNGEAGFVTDDPELAAKRAKLLAWYERHREDFAHSGARAWRDLVVATGFVKIMGGLFTGDLVSQSRNQNVYELIADRWQISFWLNFLSILSAYAIAIPLGIRSARRQGSLEDRVTTNALFLAWSLPSFFVGTLFLYHFCTPHGGRDPWFPNRAMPADADTLWMSTPRYLLTLGWHWCLPLIVLCYGSFTVLSRYMRGNLLEQLDADYVRTARAKGVGADAVVYRHALPNSLITMITLSAGLLAELFGGSVIVENIFSVPGLGTLLLDAAKQNDAPLVMASTVISVSLLLVGILVADLLYGVVDPRIRNRHA